MSEKLVVLELNGEIEDKVMMCLYTHNDLVCEEVWVLKSLHTIHF